MALLTVLKRFLSILNFGLAKKALVWQNKTLVWQKRFGFGKKKIGLANNFGLEKKNILGWPMASHQRDFETFRYGFEAQNEGKKEFREISKDFEKFREISRNFEKFQDISSNFEEKKRKLTAFRAGGGARN